MSKQEDGMKVQKIDAKTFRKMFLAGAKGSQRQFRRDFIAAFAGLCQRN